jgi:PTS system nitrogen regulatory IIA component
MEIKEFLSSTQATIDLRAPDKDSLLRELSQRAAATVRLNADSISSEILKREKLGSTGIGGGVAIPHARIKGLKKPFGILARLKSAIDFDAIDNKSVDIVFLLLLPVETEGEHITALASVARILRDAETVGKLRHASDNADIYRVMTEDRKSKIT